MDDLERRIVETEQRCKLNSHRIEELETENKALSKLATSVELLAHNMQQMALEQTKQGERLDLLEKQPGERWNTMTRTVFQTLLSTLAGGLVGAVLALIVK